MEQIKYAFTTRIPLAVMIVLGIKKYENRSYMPKESSGKCAITCSKNSSKEEYDAFLEWANKSFNENVLKAMPPWSEVESWRGKAIAVCNYESSYSKPNPIMWDEGYKVWWKLSNVNLLEEPIPCKGKCGMWKISDFNVD